LLHLPSYKGLPEVKSLDLMQATFCEQQHEHLLEAVPLAVNQDLSRTFEPFQDSQTRN
jgi:hypothetical protein